MEKNGWENWLEVFTVNGLSKVVWKILRHIFLME